MATIKHLAQRAYDTAEVKGFHEPIDHEVAELSVRLLLIVSELTEAFEKIRKGDDVGGFREEIADAAIRLLHLAEYESIDLESEILRKMAINESRPFKHGKKF